MPRSSSAASRPAVEKPHLLILGLGFTGSKFASACLAQGWDVTGTSRDKDATAPHVGDNYAHLIGPEHSAETLDAAIAQATHILATAPVDRSTGQDPFIQLHGHALGCAAVSGRVQWAGYLSTTSVYGNHDGAWVDEDTPTQPSLKRGVLRVNAEHAWRATGLPMHVFRLPGIYGPGRGPLPRARAGTAKSIVKEGQMFSRIHVDDIVGTLVASLSAPNPGRVYNVCDDEPAPTHQVTEYCCSLLGVAAPVKVAFEDVKEMSVMARSFYRDNKKVRNTRIKQELEVVLKYSTYREGLAAQLKEELQNEEDENNRVLALQRTLGQLQLIAKATAFGTFHIARSSTVNLFTLLFGTTNRLYYAVKRFIVALLFRRDVFDPLENVSLPPLSREFILVDNGSLRPEPTIQLRKLASRLSNTVGESVVAVSARHSSKIDQTLLGDKPAATLVEYVKSKAVSLVSDEKKRKAEEGNNVSKHNGGYEVVALPLFLGPSDSVVKYTPTMLAKLVSTCAKSTIPVRTRVAPVLFDPSVVYFPATSANNKDAQQQKVEEEEEDDTVIVPPDLTCPSLSKIMLKMVRNVAASKGLSAPLRVVLVDHGTPNINVNRVRRGLAAQLRQLLCKMDPLACVLDVSMERRPGKEYDFNEPLLENAFEVIPGWEFGDVVVVFAFLCPGRHAGPGGDLAEILEEVERKHQGLRLHPTGLLADDENLDELLELLVGNARSSL